MLYRTQPSVLLILATLASLGTVGCQKAATPVSPAGPAAKTAEGQVAQKDYYQSALDAIRHKEYEAAEADLIIALKLDPKHDKARLELAKLYARQAGVEVEDQLRAFWQGAKRASKLIDDVIRATKAIEGLIGADALSLEDGQRLSDRELEVRKALRETIKTGSKLTAVASVLVESFTHNPSESELRISKIGRALDVLHKNPLSPAMRSLEERELMSMLSMVHLTHVFKKVIGDIKISDILQSILQSKALSDLREKVCSVNVGELREDLADIQTGLELLKEGLANGSDDPATSEKELRVELRAFVKQIGGSPILSKVDRLFSKSTPEGFAASLAAKAVCGSGRNQKLSMQLIDSLEAQAASEEAAE